MPNDQSGPNKFKKSGGSPPSQGRGGHGKPPAGGNSQTPRGRDGGRFNTFKPGAPGNFKPRDGSPAQFGDRPPRSDRPAPGRGFGGKPNTFKPKAPGNFKPRDERGFNSPRDGSSAQIGDRPPRSDRPAPGRGFGGKPNTFKPKAPFGPKPGGDRKPYAGKPVGDRKPYAGRPDGDRKPYGGNKPYGGKPAGEGTAPERKEFKPRYGSGGAQSGGFDRKPSRGGEAYGGKPGGFKPSGERGYGAGNKFPSSGGRPANRDSRPSPAGRGTGFGGGYADKPKITREPITVMPTREAREERADAGDLIYGRNAVLELLKAGAPIDKLYLQSGQREGSITLIASLAVKAGIPIIEASREKLGTMCGTGSHQGAVASVSQAAHSTVDDILEAAEKRGQKPLIVIAENVMDPQNLGALIRAAECAGAHGIVIPKRNAAGVTSAAFKASAGAAAHLPVARVANIANTIEQLKTQGVWAYAAAAHGEPGGTVPIGYREADYTVPCAVVVGSEGEGLSRIVRRKCDALISIPLYGKIDSLNVSCAAAVILYEAASQRGGK